MTARPEVWSAGTVDRRATATDGMYWEEVAQRAGALWPRLLTCRLDLDMEQAAMILGLGGPAALQRHLRQAGLPPFRLLRDWCYVTTLLERTAPGHDALATHRAIQGRDPAPYYRFIRRVTGRTWVELRHLGAAWARRAALATWAPFITPPLR